jgi:hypothetical protein
MKDAVTRVLEAYRTQVAEARRLVN